MTAIENAQRFLKEANPANPSREQQQQLSSRGQEIDELVEGLVSERLATDALGTLQRIDELLNALRKVRTDISNAHAVALVNTCPDDSLKVEFAALGDRRRQLGAEIGELRACQSDQQALIASAEGQLETVSHNRRKFPQSAQEQAEHDRLSRVLAARCKTLAEIESQLAAKQVKLDQVAVKIESHKSLMRAA